MHRGLQILEIVELLCAEVAGDLPQYGVGPPECQHLAALARTCKTFQDPALDLLWSHQRNTMMNLLMCMPDNLWCSPVPTDVKLLGFHRPITAADWERPLTYMRRVKTFAYSLQTMPSPQLLQALSLSFPGEHFFPTLQKLYWNTPNTPHAPHIWRFISPKITRTILAFGDSDHDLSLLPTVAISCPSMTDATIYCPTREDVRRSVLQGISQFVLGLAAIESLSILDLDQAAFEHLAQLPTIKSLEIRRPDAFNPSCKIGEGDVFLSLQRLKFNSIAPGSIARFLHPFSDSPLVSLAMNVEPTSLAAPGLYSFIAENCSRATLRDLHVGSTELVMSTHRRRAEPQIIRDDMIRLLLGLTALNSLCLYSCDGFDLDDSTLSGMAASWPDIERLDLMVVSTYEGFTPRTTLHSLYAFARHCPRLRTLKILFDATVVPSTDADAEISQGALTCLSLGRSSIFAPAADVAAFLCRLFPVLQELHTGYHQREWEGYDDQLLEDRVIYHRRWKQVERLLPAHVEEEVEESGSESEDGS
ncbi:hypothetical protein B0H16DRAFT_1695096 [Mycena metata]|uniref:F-box domain-containing protein n=1 Tax=Mycena metata TaxID=1033252 RepID=A0AAD7MXU6_9AGAR|nr:hypothetical protein B0H16DRAFT_1695096 [Mycena metata]